MANGNAAALIDKLKLAAYVNTFRQVFGADLLSDVDAAFDRIMFAIARYQKEDPDFRTFDSKYDRFLDGKLVLSDADLRGLALFNSPAKGNCAACHPSARGCDGSPPATSTSVSAVLTGPICVAPSRGQRCATSC